MASGVMIHIDSAIRWLLAEEKEELEREKRRFLLHCILVALGIGIASGVGFDLLPVQWTGFGVMTEMGRVGIDHRAERVRAEAMIRAERSHYD